jgi:hypothetical protein
MDFRAQQAGSSSEHSGFEHVALLLEHLRLTFANQSGAKTS